MTDRGSMFASAGTGAGIVMFRRAALVIAVLTGGPAGTVEYAAGQTVSANRQPDVSANSQSLVSTNQTVSADQPVPTNQSSSPVPTDSSSARTDSTQKAKKKNELADTVYYEADYIDYDNEERVLSLMGRATVRYQNVTLIADTIVYTMSNDQFQARGKPQLVEGKDTTVGDFMAYNIKTRRGRVSYAFTRFDDTYVTGSNIVKTRDNRLYIEQGDYTTCRNPQHPHYYFYGRHILVLPDDKVVGRPVVMNVGDAPVAVLPYFVMPLQRGRRSGWLTPSWGGSVASGGYIDNVGYYYAPNDYVDATLAGKVQEFNSFVFNARGRYNLRYALDGEVSGRYVFDNRLENTSRQWALDYRHNQLLTPDGGTRLSGYGNLVSNSSFNRLYSDQTYELEKQQLDANMALSHRFNDINASANLVWRRNHNLTTDKIAEDMPAFDFRLQNRALLPYKAGGAKSEPSWYNNIYYAYDTKANVRREAHGSDSVKGFIRPGMEHNVNLTATQKILRYIDVSPNFNMRASMFYGAIDTTVRGTRDVYDTVSYDTPDLATDARAPDYILIDAQLSTFSDGYGGIDSVYRVRKRSPLPVSRLSLYDTLDTEFNIVKSWSAGLNLSTRVYGLFPVNALGITAIRHTLVPTVGYAFTPKHELNRKFYPVGINYADPRTKAEQLVTFGLSNSFQGKRTVAGRADGADRVNRGDGGGGAANSGVSGINNGNGISGGDSISNAGISSVSGIGSVDNNSIGGIDNDSVGGIDNGGIGSVNNDGINTISSDSINNVRGVGKEKGKDAKREEKFDILTLSMNTAYNMEAEARRWRELSLSASTGISILNVSFSSGFWFYDEKDSLTPPTMSRYSVDLTSGRLGVGGRFWDGDLLELDMAKTAVGGAQNWSVGFSPSLSYRASRTVPAERFTPTKSFNVSSSANINLTKSLSVRWNGNYDFSSDKFSHNSFDFYYDLECWEMRFTWRPEKINPGFNFVVNVKKIPDIKWEQKESGTTRVL